MDFEKLKSSYILSIQSGLLAGVGYEDIKNANKVINHFFKYYIDAGVSNEAERAEMKHELDMIEKTLEKEIDSKLGVRHGIDKSLAYQLQYRTQNDIVFSRNFKRTG